jgi:tripartite-type tricarboxylate transporter receptor subunit TctC
MKTLLLLFKMGAISICGFVIALGAQVLPGKTIQYIIPFPPAGESDLVARYQAELSAQKYNQPMIVINRAGAGGGLAWSQLNSYANDGTFVVGVNIPHIILQPLQEGATFKTDDIQAIYYYHFTPDALMVSVDSPYKTYQDLVNAAKKNPGKLNIAGYIPFKGTGDLIASLIGMHVDGAMGYLPLAIQQKTKIRTLAIATEKRHPSLPDVPTFKELGLNWVDGGYRGVAVPKSTPKETQEKLSNFFGMINADPVIKKKLEEDGFVLVDIPLEKIPAFMKEKIPQALDDAKNAGMIK